MAMTVDEGADRRRRLLLLSAAGAWAPRIAGASEGPRAATLRIGFQKYGNLTLLKARGTLEPRLARSGVAVEWTEFPAGPQMLEALNVGSIDFGTVGEAPPIFAQAAGAPIVYVAHQPPAPNAEAIVVPRGSTLRSVAELRGRRVALNKGSNVHYLLVRALQSSALAYAQIEPVYLAPADARAAFERGAVDAWAIWDPFFAAAEVQLQARVLRDGTGLVSNHQFFLAARGYAQREPQVIATLVDELARLDAWAARNVSQVTAVLAPELGLPLAVVDRASSRLTFGIAPVDAKVATEQQRIADAFADLGLIPHRIRIAEALPPAELALALRPPAPLRARVQ